MFAQTVVYMDKKASTTGKFTEEMAAFLEKVSAQGIEVAAAVPNIGGVSETLGIWLFLRMRVEGT